MFGGPMHRMQNINEEKAHDTGQAMRRLGSYLKPYWLTLLGVGALLIVGSLLLAVLFGPH